MTSVHLYPMGKGDPLCPLGFHPQVRWPTRCKRCFRDYKEHGGKRRDIELRKDETTASSPSLGHFDNQSEHRRSWASSTNLEIEKKPSETKDLCKNPSSWISTPDLTNLEDDTQANIPTVSLTLPFRRKIPVDTGQNKYVVPKPEKVSTVFCKSDTLAARVKKLNAIKESSAGRSKRIQIKEIKPTIEESSNDVQFLIQVKSTPKKEQPQRTDNMDVDDDVVSLTGTETTESTILVDPDEFDLKKEVEDLKQELDITKNKCERLEKEKGNILLRRLAAMDTSKGNSFEVLKLQQKLNELQGQLDDYKDEKKVLNLKVKELEEDLETRPTSQAAQKVEDELRSKLLAAETLCEELMDENEDMKKELRDLEDEMDEMQDNFREDQADEYSTLKKELEQTTKNCRILSFKLRKTERKTELLEAEKLEAEKKMKELSCGTSVQYLEKIKQLEKDLHLSYEATTNVQNKLDETTVKLTNVLENKLTEFSPRKTPKLGMLGKSASTDMKISRESLTRGGSQEDPVQLLRDLQDSLEREADLREQLKFAEEEAQTMRKKVSRIEEDNESIVLQLKKMATKTRPRKMTSGKDDSMEQEDASDLKLQLELSEQETSVLRKKLEDIEVDNERLTKKAKELRDKMNVSALNRRVLLQVDKDKTQDEKIKVLENELCEIKKKLIQKEKDCERLEAATNTSMKRSKELAQSKSLDLDQKTIDLKMQLQVIEQEASVFRNKVHELEVENEKLLSKNKRLELNRGTKNLKSDKVLDTYVDKIANLEIELEAANKKIKELEEAKDKKSKTNDSAVNTRQIKQIEKERDKLQELLNKIKENNYSLFTNRKPCVLTELTTKAQMRVMVNNLENEIEAVLITLGNVEKSKEKLEDQLSRTPENKDIVNKEIEDLTKKIEAADKEIATSKAEIDDFVKQLKKSNEVKDSIKSNFDKMKKDYDKIVGEKQIVEEEIAKLKKESLLSNNITNDFYDVKGKYETVKINLEKSEAEIKKLKEEIEIKNKIAKELHQKTKKITELQNQIRQMEENQLKNELNNTQKVKSLEDILEKEKQKKEDEESQKSEKYETKIKLLNKQLKELENTIHSQKKTIDALEKDLAKERANAVTNSSDPKELKKLQEEINKLKTQLSEFDSKFRNAEQNSKTVEEKLKKSENTLKTEKSNFEKKSTDLYMNLQTEKQKVQTVTTALENVKQNKELELTALKNKIKNLELNTSTGNKKISEIRQEYQGKIDEFEKNLSKKQKEYENLTAKYEVLEEEHVVTKAKLVTEMESLTSQLLSFRRDIDKIKKETETEKEEWAAKYEALLKDKNALLDQVGKINKNGDNLEKVRLKASLEEKQSELEQLRREYEVITDQMEYSRRDNDELKKKLDDYNKVSKIQRNISADTSAMGHEIEELKNKLNAIEKTKKSDLTELKMRYESQITILNDEMQSLHGQVSRFKRERDTYKHMLEGAQKTIGDLKTNPRKAGHESWNSVGYDEIEEQKTKILSLEQQISCMEDELSESRLEGSKLKTELISERSSCEVKISELQSRVNELEEEKILSSGRTKIAGLRTRMELSWQKEREEQQRLLQETATLARDLRQTLFEVERERNKDVLESKRKVEQLKKSLEEDQDESKKKLNEIQCDFMELRDAHAKLRTTNEKLRREKERYEKEREEMKFLINGKKRLEQEDIRRINNLVQQVESLLQLAPELFGTREHDPSTFTPKPPKRIKSKSREGSPAMESKDYSRESSMAREDKRTQVQSTLKRLVDATDELKRIQRLSEEDRERERMKRAMGMRRATSTENDKISKNGTSTRKYSRDTNLHRKSLSLEHTASLQDPNIWKGDDDSMSSMQSLDMSLDIDFRKIANDDSMDSRLSGGSTQSDISGEKRKKKGIMGKLKKLTKSRSIDDQDSDHFSPTRQLISKPNSNLDVNEDTKGSKKDLKERITDMFRRTGSSSRSNSVERQMKHDTSSTQRPLMRNGSNSNLTTKDPNMDKLLTRKHKVPS